MKKLINYFVESFHDLTQPSKMNIPALDFLRILAVTLVIAGHFNEPWVAAGIALPKFLAILGGFGWTGVDLFFILSGFLISGQIFKELDRTGDLKVSRFFIRRGFRIWPLYFFFFLFITFYLRRPFPTAWGPWPDLLFFANFVKGTVTGGWSLSTEEQFYLIAPVSLLFLWKKGRRWIPFFYVAAFLVYPLIRQAVISGFQVALDQHSAVEKYLYFPIITHSDALLAGSFLSWISFRKITLSLQKQILFSFVPVGVFLALRMHHKDLFGFSALALVYFSVTWLVLRPEMNFLFPRWTHRGAFFFSRLTYGMYLNHFEWVRIYRSQFNRTGSIWLELALMIGISAATALVTFLLIERPFLLLRERLMSSH